MVRQLSQEQSTTGSNPVCEQQLFQLARHTWCRSEVSVFDESFATSGTSFKRVINGFKSRLHCQILLILEQQKQIIGRLAYQRGQLSVKQPLLALQVRLLPDLPIMESNPIRRLLRRAQSAAALFAKQMDEQLWFESTALRL
jgi:hypothetical protein